MCKSSTGGPIPAAGLLDDENSRTMKSPICLFHSQKTAHAGGAPSAEAEDRGSRTTPPISLRRGLRWTMTKGTQAVRRALETECACGACQPAAANGTSHTLRRALSLIRPQRRRTAAATALRRRPLGGLRPRSQPMGGSGLSATANNLRERNFVINYRSRKST